VVDVDGCSRGNGDAAVTWTPDLTYELLDVDGTLIGAIALPRNRTGKTQAALSATGAGALVVDPGSDPVSSIAATYRYGRYVRVKLNGTAIHTWRIEAPAPKDDPNIAGGSLALAGRGWACDFDGALVLPPVGVSQRPAPDYRIFSWASPDFPNVDGSWVTPTAQSPTTRQTPDATGALQPAPIGFPDADAEWIGPSDSTPVGMHYYRTTFTVAADTTIAFAASGDNFYTVYLDGVPIIREADKTYGWSEHRRAEQYLTAGTYTIAAQVENVPWTLGTNPSGLLLSVFTLDANANPATVLRRSEATADWEMLGTLVTEAQARGLLDGWSLGFDDVDDSASDAWSAVPMFTCPIGVSILRVMGLLYDAAWIDYLARPGARVLDAWIEGGSVASGVTLKSEATSTAEGGSDVALYRMNHGQTDRAPNRVVVRYANGYLLRDDTTAQTADGFVEEQLLTVDTVEVAEAERLGDVALARTTDAAGAIRAYVDPIDPASTPWSGFDLRETVTVPDREATPVVVRTLALTVVDDGIEPVYEGEWNRRQRTAAVKQAERLASLGQAVVGDAPGSRPVTASARGGYTPSSVPLIESEVVRPLLEADFPSGAPGGGSSGPAIPFIWTWAGRLNYAEDIFPAIPVITAETLVNVTVIQRRGTAALAFAVKVNNTTIDNFSVSAATETTDTISVPVVPGDYVHIVPTSIGSGNADVVSIAITP
jgi:hypothetical protein